MPLANATVRSRLRGGVSPAEVAQFLSLYWTEIPLESWRDLARSGSLTEGTPLAGKLLAA